MSTYHTIINTCILMTTDTIHKRSSHVLRCPFYNTLNVKLLHIHDW